MSNVNLALTSGTTTYTVSIDQVRQLIAENLDVPEEVVTVRYVLQSHNYDGPGYAGQFVDHLEVTVDNVALQRMHRAACRTRPLT